MKPDKKNTKQKATPMQQLSLNDQQRQFVQQIPQQQQFIQQIPQQQLQFPQQMQQQFQPQQFLMQQQMQQPQFQQQQQLLHQQFLPQQQFPQQIQQLPQQLMFNSQQILNSKKENICYNKDEKPIQNAAIKNEKKLEIPKVEDLIILNVKAENSRIQLDHSAKTIKALISVKTKDFASDFDNSAQRPGIDLICVIDRSGSMSGEKIILVMKTLDLLIQLLTEQDRISLIMFDTQATCLCQLIPLTKPNLQKLKYIISKISAGGGTFMGSGTEIAFNMIKNRQFKNKVTSIFVLGDGQDSEAKQVAQQQFKQYNIRDEAFTLHTFGFGSDHDPVLMRDLANLKDGNFYYIETLKAVDQCFLDALGGLVSLVSQKAELTCQIHPNLGSQFSDLRIKKIYGYWNFNEEKRLYSQNFNYLIAGKSKDFILEINVPPMKKDLIQQEKYQKVLKVQLMLVSLDQKEYKFEKELQIEFCNQNEMIDEVEDQDIELNYLRVTGADAIEQANKLAAGNNYKEAQKILDSKINEIKNSQFAKQDLLVVLLEDLQSAKQGCTQINYQQFGQKIMTNFQNVHFQQQSAQGVGYGPQQKQIYSTNMQQFYQQKRR